MQEEYNRMQEYIYRKYDKINFASFLLAESEMVGCGEVVGSFIRYFMANSDILPIFVQ